MSQGQSGPPLTPLDSSMGASRPTLSAVTGISSRVSQSPLPDADGNPSAAPSPGATGSSDTACCCLLKVHQLLEQAFHPPAKSGPSDSLSPACLLPCEEINSSNQAQIAALNLMAHLNGTSSKPVPGQQKLMASLTPDPGSSLPAAAGSPIATPFGAAQGVLVLLGGLSGNLSFLQKSAAGPDIGKKPSGLAKSPHRWNRHPHPNPVLASMAVPNLIGSERKAQDEIHSSTVERKPKSFFSKYFSGGLRFYKSVQQSKQEASGFRAFLLGGLAALGLTAILFFAADVRAGEVVAAFSGAVALLAALSWRTDSRKP